MNKLREYLYNERLIYALGENSKEKNDIILKELKELVNVVTTVATGILANLISTSVVSIMNNQLCKEEPIEKYILVTTIFCLFLFIIIWYCCIKWIVPFFSKLLHKEIINIDYPKKEVIANKFNTEIIQKIIELNEIVDVALSSTRKENKVLILALGLYKYQEIIDFFNMSFVINEIQIRKTSEDSPTGTFKYSLNKYILVSVIQIISDIETKINKLLSNIKNDYPTEYKLLEYDFQMIQKDSEKVKKKIRE